MSKNRIIAAVVLGLLVVGARAIAQVPDCYVRAQITSPSLEGNPLGDPATRPLLVYLPPSYASEPERRYPTIYLLHGFAANETSFVSGGDADLYYKSFGVDLGVDVGNIVTDLIRQIGREGGNLANTAILVANGRGPTLLGEEVAAAALVAALYEKALSFTYVPTPGDHLSDLRMKLSVALEFLYPHIAPDGDTE